ncbi:OmpA family protein [Mangrovimonas sp. YM274]|uniref:OmpA family protein n=1 Tax=Mangrovimonas sp. YM274 TaxID=3070660 RepID=UPI0027DC038D|nr:OmpA family protein [Mangrovimonas sp. YM274]WMI69015.1 OmpA family protein [Mangrovimonas sp. YM274]
MKKIYSLLCLLMCVAASYGQNAHTEKADELFESYQYVDAIDAYLKLVDNNKADTYVYKQLGDCYYNVFNTEEAAKWYAKATQTTQDAETYYRYAQTLKSQGKYEEANKQMDVFAKMMPEDQRAITHMKNPNYVPSLADQSKLFEVGNVGINNQEQADFGSVLSNDNTLYFVSSRGTNRKDNWTNSPYLDIYQSVRNDDGTLSEPEELKSLNTPFHDGPITLSTDGNTMIFARDGHSTGNYKKIKKHKVKVGQQGLYSATKEDGKWGNIQALPFNSTEYSVSHPSLSADGKTLYFASNMPGGFGDTDIWKVSVNGNSYGTPENLGANVNTAGKEGFPFISEDHILYFASTGKQGLGGFDIFKVDLSKNEDAINLGKPVNTKSDDFSFSVNTKYNIGYFSSNRSGVDNIYTAIPVCIAEAVALVKDANSGSVLANASVSILDNQSNVIATKTNEANGTAAFGVECETAYYFTVARQGYKTATVEVAPSKGGTTNVTVVLEPEHELITETEVKLNNIYFEFDKSNITQQGAFELDKLVAIMNDYPEMEILVRSHTDTKGNQEYNQKLSERRAQATMQYLISKGIAKERLSAKGMGSSEPKIDCKSNCTKEEDAQNRRSEFLIVKK